MSKRSRWSARTRLTSLSMLGLVLTALLSAAPAPAQERDPRVVTAWNALAYEIGFAEDQFLTFKAHRAFAMMHLAMHDALNSIIPVYERFSYHQRRTLAHPVVAAAQAAHAVLLSQYPGERAKLDAELAIWLENVPDAWPKRRGIALGKATAAAILARREGDGWDTPGTYTFRTEPGQYQSTPPWNGPPYNGFVAQPGFRDAKPFGIANIVAFRSPAPPPLDSAAYARALNEVKDFGSATSTQRTADQTGCAASFHMLEQAFGDRVSFTMTTKTAPPDMPSRSFGSFDAAAAECADSRVRLGYHFRYATDAGLTLGRSIARHIVRHTLRREHR